MNALEDDLLEEAKQPIHEKNHKIYWYSVAAACFFLFILIQFPFTLEIAENLTDISEMNDDFSITVL